jgi:hypothetical protein
MLFRTSALLSRRRSAHDTHAQLRTFPVLLLFDFNAIPGLCALRHSSLEDSRFCPDGGRPGEEAKWHGIRACDSRILVHARDALRSNGAGSVLMPLVS